MSILTKVFIVVMVVLAIVSSIVFIQKANTEVNYKMANEALQQQLGLYGANLAASELAKEDQKRRNLEIQASTGEVVRSSEAMLAQKQQALEQALG
ncbi:MAG: hypothetical protein HQ546_11710, partial [Planctomycetes bacterium]|nr:hypothetical protein [Planctomycetota bacterium]